MVESDTVSQLKASPIDIYLGICKENYEGSANPVLEIAHVRKRAFLKLTSSFFLEVEYTDIIKETRSRNVVFYLSKNGSLETRVLVVQNVLNFTSRILSAIE